MLLRGLAQDRITVTHPRTCRVMCVRVCVFIEVYGTTEQDETSDGDADNQDEDT